MVYDLNLKSKLLEECKKIQLKAVDNLRAVIDEAQQSANEYGAPKDRYDSFRMQLLRKKDMYSQQIEKSLLELQTLEKIDVNKKMLKVDFGALVITNNQKIFISVGLGKIIIDSETFYAVSPMVPLSKLLKGRQKGETVTLNGKNIEIIEVF